MKFNRPEGASTSYFPEEYPLSHGQAALWFLYKAIPESVAYNLAGAVAISDDIDLQALRRAFEKLAERHPMLRTFFTEQHGKPAQRVLPSIEIAFQCEDASGWNPAQLDEALAKAIYRPFDLERGPTWRVVAFQQAPIANGRTASGSPRETLVLLVLHHIIGDLWSIAVVMSEIAAIYREETTGYPVSLKPLRASYADYVHREQARLAGPEAEASWNYWHRALPGEHPPLKLPVDRQAPPMPSGRGAQVSIHLDAELVEQLQALADQRHVAVYTVLLAAFQTLLYRYTGQNEVLVGFTKAGRASDMGRVIGYFVNQVVLSADFASHPSFVDLLLQLHKSFEAGAKHEWYPFSLLVQRLCSSRHLDRSPLIQAVFSWQQAPRLIPHGKAGAFALGQADDAVDLGGLSARSISLPHRVAPFDLTVLAAETQGGLAVTFVYAADLFDAATIARMAESYHTLLENIVLAPTQSVATLGILPKAVREQLLSSWNATTAPYPDPACLHQLFEQQAERTPEAVAIADKHEQLSYRQLNQRANQLAHFLIQCGVGPDTLVGVSLESSAQLVIALLGILKAGGAYVPLDPTYPEERLAFMLADTQPALLVTQPALRQHLPNFTGRIICSGAEEASLRHQPRNNPASSVTPGHLAYVMYTSGSTGAPKGIALAHRGVVSLLADFQRYQAIRPSDACSWWTSACFDVSVYEIFSPLLAGGSLQVIPEEMRLDIPGLLEWLSSHHIRSAYLPPFMLADFTAWVENHPAASEMRRLLVGVEPIPEALLIRLARGLPGLCILNGYGPTETTICSTLYTVDGGCLHHGNTPIGRPAANTHIYLLDRSMQPVPVGVVGEIYIGGIGLARGYWNRPELTCQHFIQSPFQADERLYRTGDLARYLPDGNLVFVGRSDTQVKLHGVRIELGEIEVALGRHPLVKQAVVLLQEQASGGKQLVAYLVPIEGMSPSPSALRQFLNQSLPRALLPSRFVLMDAFPLTPTGKVDRKALPTRQDPQPRQENTQPSWANAEQALVTIWQDVLGLEQVSVDDNFFELGGDSITSLQIIARAREAGLHLSPQDIFQAPTIAELAALADRAALIQEKWVDAGMDDTIPLTPIQRWFFERNFPDPHHWNQSLMFVARESLDLGHLRSAVSDLLIQHDALRLRYINGSFGWQETCTSYAEDVPFETIDLSTLTGAQQADAIEASIAAQQRSLDLATGPLIRVVYFILGESRPGRLLIVIHHLAIDAVSWRILLEDLQTAYRQHERGQLVQPPYKTINFRTWARCLDDFAQSPALMQEAGFWLRSIGTDLPTLPADLLPPGRRPAELNTEASVQSVSISLGREETQLLLKEATSRHRSEINTVLLTALTRAYQLWTNTEVLWIDLESHGREPLLDGFDVSRTVGWFTALYPIRLDLPRNVGPERAVQMVKEQLHQIPRHGLGYGLLRYLCRDRALSDQFRAIPFPSVSFNYLGQLVQSTAESIIAGPAPESVGHQRCPDAQRPHLIEINAAIVQGELYIDWSYSSRLHSRHCMKQVAGLFIDQLRTLITSGCIRDAATDMPSDFPETKLSHAQLNAVLEVTSRSKAPAPQRSLEAMGPLSPVQEGMIFHTLYTPQGGSYFEQITFTVQGQFDIPSFRKAWQRVCNRHSILRTSFVRQGLEGMLQVVHKHVKLPMELLDWREIPASEQASRLDSLLASERRRGFDLSMAPLLRLSIFQTADDAHRILINYHHALLDGWSVWLLLKEVFAFYTAFIGHRDLRLPPARPYRDYIAWLQARDLSAAESFWRKELSGVTPAAWGSLESWKATPAYACQAAEQKECLPSHTTTALQALVRRRHLTMSTLVQGAWAILLDRRLRRNEVVFGITVAGRPSELPGVMTMIGLFINTLPLRVQITPQSPLLDWLRRIQDKTVEMQQYGYSPLTKIQAWSGAPRRLPLFDTLLVVENYPAPLPVQGQLGNLQIGDIRSIELSPYPLTVALSPGERLTIRILYDPDRFEAAAIQGLLGQLRQVLESMVVDPDQLLGSLLPETPSEYVQLLENRSASSGDTRGRASPLHEHQVKQGPEQKAATAETAEEESIPRNVLLENHLLQIWSRLLKTDPVEINDNFFELGGDSLTGAICIQQLRDDLQVAIPLAAIFEAPTVFELARYLEKNYPACVARFRGTPVRNLQRTIEAARPAAIVPIQPNGSKCPLFCVHPAGGIVFPYYALAPYLGKDQPLFGIQDPSLYGAQSAAGSIEAMASGYLKALRMVQPEGPYQLLGWSVGGVVAYEMAQLLSRQGQAIAALIILDANAPTPARGNGARCSLGLRLQQRWSWLRALPNRIQRVGSAIGPIASYIRSGLFLLAASEKRKEASSHERPTIVDLWGWAVLDTWRARLLRKAEVANAVSQDASLLLVELPEVRRILKLVREHGRLARRYAAVPFPGRIILFRASRSSRDEEGIGSTMGWGMLAKNGVEVRDIQANHVALLVQPYVEVLARELKACLDQGNGPP